jgi:iron complex outermembrane receptor protein
MSAYNALASNLYAPVAVTAPAVTPTSALNDPMLTQRTELSSFALADTLSFAQDRVLVTVGARHQTIKDRSYDYTTGAQNGSYDRSAVTPIAGLVVKPMQNLSLYANYVEALTRGAVAGGTVRNLGEVFSPYRSRQKEIGAKYDAGQYGVNVALFSTSQPMGVVNSATNLFGIDGEQRNRGAELTVYGAPTRGLRLLGGLTLLDAEQRKTAGGVNEGRDVIGAPKLQANLGAEWDVPGVRGLALNGRMLHTASQYADAANTQKLPSWRRFDAGVRYVTNWGKQAITLRGQIENLTDRDYWASAGGYPGLGYLVLGAPRTLTVSATIDF